MSSFFKWFLFSFNLIRCCPHLFLFYFHKNRSVIKADVKRWLNELKFPYTLTIGFIYLLGFVPEYRNLFYCRIGGMSAHVLSVFCPRMSTLLIDTDNIGEGLVIRHGVGSNIGAISIGKNCTIYQQVTLGNYKGFPTILDNVIIYPGAVVMGKITIGNNSVIGANASVFQDVPDNCTVYPARPLMMKWKTNYTKTAY